MHQYKGKLIVHTGSMFSGKTSSLKRDIKRFTIAGYDVVAFKPAIDNRYSESKIVTHDNVSTEAVPVREVLDIINYCKENKPEVIAIDEIQFLEGELEDIVRFLGSCLDKGQTIIVAGLDMDYRGKPFEIVKELMPISNYLYKHHAVCVGCGSDAWISHRKVEDDERIVIGTSEEYEPLCRDCYVREKTM